MNSKREERRKSDKIGTRQGIFQTFFECKNFARVPHSGTQVAGLITGGCACVDHVTVMCWVENKGREATGFVLWKGRERRRDEKKIDEENEHRDSQETKNRGGSRSGRRE